MMGISLGILIGKQKQASSFIGILAPSLLIMGLYNKVVKQDGHDMDDKVAKEGTSKQTQREKAM